MFACPKYTYFATSSVDSGKLVTQRRPGAGRATGSEGDGARWQEDRAGGRAPSGCGHRTAPSSPRLQRRRDRSPASVSGPSGAVAPARGARPRQEVLRVADTTWLPGCPPAAPANLRRLNRDPPEPPPLFLGGPLTTVQGPVAFDSLMPRGHICGTGTQPAGDRRPVCPPPLRLRGPCVTSGTRGSLFALRVQRCPLLGVV